MILTVTGMLFLFREIYKKSQDKVTVFSDYDGKFTKKKKVL
jgi:hypothetical protein